MQVPDTPLRLAARRRLEAHGVLVLFEDNHVLAVAKPAGLLSQGGPSGATSLVEVLGAYRREAEAKAGRAYVGLVHRLDRNVSGVLVVAKTSKAAARLSACFRARGADLEKTYLAWVAGVPARNHEELVHRLRRAGGVTRLAGDGDEDAREARLAYEVEGRGPDAARLRVRLETGLPHQIRAQLALAGHPLLGDVKYGGPPGSRVALHALRLVVAHPVGGVSLRLEAPVPDGLRALDRHHGIRPGV